MKYGSRCSNSTRTLHTHNLLCFVHFLTEMCCLYFRLHLSEIHWRAQKCLKQTDCLIPLEEYSTRTLTTWFTLSWTRIQTFWTTKRISRGLPGVNGVNYNENVSGAKRVKSPPLKSSRVIEIRNNGHQERNLGRRDKQQTNAVNRLESVNSV